MSAEQRPTCAVRGAIRPGAMCGAVIVGGKFCGFAGDCQHKVEPPTADPRAAARQGGKDGQAS